MFRCWSFRCMQLWLFVCSFHGSLSRLRFVLIIFNLMHNVFLIFCFPINFFDLTLISFVVHFLHFFSLFVRCISLGNETCIILTRFVYCQFRTFQFRIEVILHVLFPLICISIRNIHAQSAHKHEYFHVFTRSDLSIKIYVKVISQQWCKSKKWKWKSKTVTCWDLCKYECKKTECEIRKTCHFNLKIHLKIWHLYFRK